MSEAAVFIEIQNQYYCIHQKWEGKKLDYKKYLASLRKNYTVTEAIAYGLYFENNVDNFVACLGHLGYETKYKQTVEGKWFAWDITIAADMLRASEEVDTIILGHSGPQLIPIIQVVQERGVEVIVLACGINKELKDVVDQWIEIPASMLEIKNVIAATAA